MRKVAHFITGCFMICFYLRPLYETISKGKNYPYYDAKK
jgi:hypothetical protein